MPVATTRMEKETMTPSTRPDDEPLISLTSVVKTYDTGEVPFTALKGVDLTVQPGEFVGLIGKSGSGKTTLINDIEMFADGDTPSLRRVLINGERPPREYRHDPSKNPIALITQHTTFLSDLPVGEFLEAHATVRAASGKHPDDMIQRTIEFANQLTG